MDEQFIVDTNDLRQGRKLIKVMRVIGKRCETVVFLYSDGSEGRPIIRPKKMTQKWRKAILEALLKEYPKVTWDLENEADQSLIEEITQA